MKTAQYWIVALVIVILVLISVIWHMSTANAPVQEPSSGSEAGTSAASSPLAGHQVSGDANSHPVTVGGNGSVATHPTGTSLGSYPIHILPSGPSVYYSSARVADEIKVSNPPMNTSISSPLTITGTAVGTWYFEASFPVILTDANGRILARTNAAALGNWMTTDFVPFSGRISFSGQKSGSKGVLVFKKDNPSGLPQNEESLELQVTFQ